MIDTRGIKARLARLVELENQQPVLVQHRQCVNFYRKQARIGIEDYKQRLIAELPEDMGFAGDPIPSYTALLCMVDAAEFVFDQTDKD